MKTIKTSFIWRALIEERGQTVIFVALGLAAMLGVGGMSIDVGHAYVVRSQLQGAANAAALAAVSDLYTSVNTVSAASSAVVADADAYSASSGGANQVAGLGTVTTTVTTPCISALMPTTSCSASGNVPNTVRVKESASVPTYFMKLFGVSTLTVNAMATAAPRGTNPWNIAIILDTTGSMGQTDSNCSGNTAEQCAMNGIELLLSKIKPCIAGASCAPSSPNTWVRVSLFAFPNVPTSTVADDYTCSGTPQTEVYTLPNVPPLTGALATAGYTPLEYTTTEGGTTVMNNVHTATYQITPPNVGNADANGFLSDFYPGTSTEQLNPDSILVKAIGNSTPSNNLTTGCLQPPQNKFTGNGETYFASAIYAAQAALQAEKAVVDPLLIASKVTSNNAIIFVSDGQANTDYSAAFPAANAYASPTTGLSGLNVTSTGTTTYSSTAANLTGTASTWGTYPDLNDPCQQAMVAAQYAKTAGTRVFGVAYGSETNGCMDNYALPALNSSSYNVPITSLSKVVPCVTVENIADSWSDFYAEKSSAGCNTTTSNSPMNSLATIFEAIASKLGPGGYLIPNNLQ
jgi:Flp pilus assembly protein TadG